MIRLLDRQKLDRGETLVIDEHRPIAQLEEIVAYAAKVGGHVVIAVTLRPSQAQKLSAIGGRHVTIQNISRVIVE